MHHLCESFHGDVFNWRNFSYKTFYHGPGLFSEYLLSCCAEGLRWVIWEETEKERGDAGWTQRDGILDAIMENSTRCKSFNTLSSLSFFYSYALICSIEIIHKINTKLCFCSYWPLLLRSKNDKKKKKNLLDSSSGTALPLWSARVRVPWNLSHDKRAQKYVEAHSKCIFFHHVWFC